MYCRFVILLGMSVFLYSPFADAAIIHGAFTGAIYSSYDTYGDIGDAGFDQQVGLGVTGTFVYDTSLAPASYCDSPLAGCYSENGSPWFQLMSMTIGSSLVFSVPGHSVRAYNEEIVGEDQLFFDAYEQIIDITDTIDFWRQRYIQLRITELNDILSGSALPMSLSWHASESTIEAWGDYFLNEEITDLALEEIISIRNYGGAFSVDTLTLTSVPLPSAALLLLSGGIGLLAGIGGKRKRTTVPEIM